MWEFFICKTFVLTGDDAARHGSAPRSAVPCRVIAHQNKNVQIRNVRYFRLCSVISFEAKYYLTIEFPSEKNSNDSNVYFIFCSQGIFAVFGRFVCSRGTSGGPEASSEEKGPGWLIIIAFTAIFLGTYPLHMYFAELYLQNDFTFLLAKYCVGFLYVVLIPFITLVAQREIRKGVVSILLRDNTQANSGSCNALDDLPNWFNFLNFKNYSSKYYYRDEINEFP